MSETTVTADEFEVTLQRDSLSFLLFSGTLSRLDALSALALFVFSEVKAVFCSGEPSGALVVG